MFTLVPPAQYSFERIRPLNTANDVENYLKNLEELTQLSVASQLLLAAQHNLKCNYSSSFLLLERVQNG